MGSWLHGSETKDSPGVYGNKGEFAPENVPGARAEAAMVCTESALFLYGKYLIIF